MYTVEPRPNSVAVLVDGTWKAATPPARTFSTAAALLRWALNERVFAHHVGGVPYPKRPDDLYLGSRDHDPGHDYHLIDTFASYLITGDHLAAMRRAARRYGEIVHHLREVEPQWRPDTSASPSGMVYYADNSTELHEINKYGKRRHRMIDPPSGDACF